MDLLRLITFLSSNWPVFLLLLSLSAVLIGRAFYGISPFQPLEELAHRQEEYRRQDKQEQFKARMVKRYLELGNSLLDSYQLDAAREDFENALKLDPTNVEAQMGLLKSAVFKPMLGDDYDPAIVEKRLQLILNENPDDKHALLFLGVEYSYIDQATALEYLQKALAQDPNLAVAYNQIGHIYDSQNKVDDALQMYEKAARLSKWNQMILNNLSYHYVLRGEYGKAIEKCTLLLSLDSRAVIAYWNLSNAYRLNGNSAGAYGVQKQLAQVLDDKNVTGLPRNQGPWVFRTAPDHVVTFYDLPQKRCYSYYSMALTCHLVDRKEEARAFLEKAQRLEIDDRTPAILFVSSNVADLEKVQPGLTDKLEQFRNMFSQGLEP